MLSLKEQTETTKSTINSITKPITDLISNNKWKISLLVKEITLIEILDDLDYSLLAKGIVALITLPLINIAAEKDEEYQAKKS